MSRRTSPIEDLLTLVARMPWPVGVALAIASFIGLRVFLHSQAVTVSDPSDLAHIAFSSAATTLAMVGQFILPGLFLIAALASFFKQRKRGAIFQAASSEPTHGVAVLNWSEFETLVAELFRHRGFSVSHSGRAGPDGGVDIELKRGAETYLVQCKHWRARKVPVMTVRELYGAMTAAQAAGGFVVTSGTFTADAGRFADGRNIELVDGHTLARFLAQHGEPSLGGELPIETSSAPVDCPKCGATMVNRVAKKGLSSGNRFWGCPKFPACRGTRPL